MYEGKTVKLQMKKAMLKGMKLDKKEYVCIIDSYESEEEKIVLRIREEYITKIKLDAQYICHIYEDDKILGCEGHIKERYQSEEGNQLLFLIDNGFYEILQD